MYAISEAAYKQVQQESEAQSAGGSAEQSEKAVKELEKKHPEFVKLAEKVYSYLDTLMSIRVQAGIVSKEQREFMKKHYGNWYVPSYRDMERGANTSGVSGRGNVGVSKSVHAAKGSNLDIQSIMLSMSQQTVGVHKQAIMNELFLKVKEIDPKAFVEKGTQRQTRDDVDGFIEPKENEVFFYENGKRITYMTTKDIAIAFESLRNSKNNMIEQSVAAKGLEKLVSAMKKVTTEYNPFFAVRNLFRDASDAFIYTKYSKNLLARYKRAYKEIRNKGEYYKLYLQNGGQALSFFDRDYGIDLRKKNALLDKISMINETTELLPRLSEFIESIESRYQGDFANIPQEVVDMAMYDASDVTVNFARGGTLTKKLNKYLMPYLNASVQGWCKTWNTFVHPTSMNAWCMSMSKVVIMALPTLLFNEIFYDDDEEYQQLSDDIKGSYFLLKVGNNKFIRIPRGRVEAVVGDAMQRIYRTAKGEEDAFDGYMSNTVKNVSPVDNLTRTILSPITDVATNTTWYGGNIENRSMQSLPIQERYDNNTSAIAKMLAKLPLGVSPKKWHYLLDQYSGIIGDVVLPLTSKNKDLSGLSGLTTNSLDNNKYTNKYYNVMEELEQAKNSDNGTAVDKAKMRYFNNMNSKISELYKAKKSTTDKEEQTAIDRINVLLENYKEDKIDNDYAIELKSEKKVIGSISINYYSKNAEGTIVLGYVLNPKYQGFGYMTETLKGMFKYLKTNNIAKRIVAQYDTQNEKSGNVMKRAGMTYEGTFRKAVTNNLHTRGDLATYSILYEEIDLDEKPKNSVVIYTDGACSGNPGIGGWGAVLFHGNTKKEISGYEEETTNNRMELTAAIKALEKLKVPCEVDLYSDSAYLINAFNEGWITSWQMNGFKNANKKPVANVELWEKLIEFNNTHKITWIKVKGHADNVYNNRCDQLATGEIAKHQN